jgi:hypothetical protein
MKLHLCPVCWAAPCEPGDHRCRDCDAANHRARGAKPPQANSAHARNSLPPDLTSELQAAGIDPAVAAQYLHG